MITHLSPYTVFIKLFVADVRCVKKLTKIYAISFTRLHIYLVFRPAEYKVSFEILYLHYKALYVHFCDTSNTKTFVINFTK